MESLYSFSYFSQHSFFFRFGLVHSLCVACPLCISFHQSDYMNVHRTPNERQYSVSFYFQLIIMIITITMITIQKFFSKSFFSVGSPCFSVLFYLFLSFLFLPRFLFLITTFRWMIWFFNSIHSTRQRKPVDFISMATSKTTRT